MNHQSPNLSDYEISSNTNIRTINEENKTMETQEKKLVTSISKLVTGYIKEGALNKDETNFTSNYQQDFQSKRRDRHRFSDTGSMLKDQHDRKFKRKENHRASDTCIPDSKRNSIGNMFNYAINTIKNNISKEILDEYEDNCSNFHNKQEAETNEEGEELQNFRDKIKNEGLLTHAAILEFLSKEKVNNERQGKQKKQDFQEKSFYVRFKTSIVKPQPKNGFDAHETFLSRAMKARNMNDAMFIHDSFKQRKMLKRVSCDEYLYDNMSDKWRKGDNDNGKLHDKKLDDDDLSFASEFSGYVLHMLENNKDKNDDSQDENPCVSYDAESGNDGEDEDDIISLVLSDAYNEMSINNEKQENSDGNDDMDKIRSMFTTGNKKGLFFTHAAIRHYINSCFDNNSMNDSDDIDFSKQSDNGSNSLTSTSASCDTVNEKRLYLYKRDSTKQMKCLKRGSSSSYWDDEISFK